MEPRELPFSSLGTGQVHPDRETQSPDTSSIDPTGISSLDHFQSDVDASYVSLHHTLGNSPNQASQGNHTHNGIDSLLIPGITGSETYHQAWAPVWKSKNDPQPAIGNGTLTGEIAVLGPIAIISLTASFGSTTSYGTGDWSFTGIPDFAKGWGDGWWLINASSFNVNRLYTGRAVVQSTSIVDIVYGRPFTEIQPPIRVGSTGWEAPWVVNNNIIMSGVYWRNNYPPGPPMGNQFRDSSDGRGAGGASYQPPKPINHREPNANNRLPYSNLQSPGRDVNQNAQSTRT